MASCQMVIVVLVFCSGFGATVSSHIGACVALFSKEVHALNCMFGILCIFLYCLLFVTSRNLVYFVMHMYAMPRMWWA